MINLWGGKSYEQSMTPEKQAKIMIMCFLTLGILIMILALIILNVKEEYKMVDGRPVRANVIYYWVFRKTDHNKEMINKYNIRDSDIKEYLAGLLCVKTYDPKTDGNTGDRIKGSLWSFPKTNDRDEDVYSISPYFVHLIEKRTQAAMEMEMLNRTMDN